MRVLILRPRELLAKTIEVLREEGFEAYGCPFIELEYLDFEVPEHDFVIVTSQNIARVLVKKSVELKKIIAIGKKTAEILKTAGYDVLVPTKFDSENLYKEFSDILRGKKVVAVRSDKGSKILYKISEISDFREIIAYRIKPLRGKEQIREIEKIASYFYDSVVYSSSMIARNFLELCREHDCLENLERVYNIAIGPPTANVLRSYGINPFMPDEYTFDGVIKLLKNLKDVSFRC